MRENLLYGATRCKRKDSPTPVILAKELEDLGLYLGSSVKFQQITLGTEPTG